jgi:hypothetical protein
MLPAWVLGDPDEWDSRLAWFLRGQIACPTKSIEIPGVVAEIKK